MIHRTTKNRKIFFTLTFYLLFLILFLKTQFQTSYQSPMDSSLKILQTQETKLQKKNDNRVIFLLIDAAKYEYNKQFDVIQRLLKQKSSNSLLKKCIVSEPTMTTQKIETLMTGSQVFSTSSILDSFFSNPVQTDNLIKQLKRAGKKTVFMGDDTWGKLFDFTRQYPCTTTFDIWDWQTCDKIIYGNLGKQIEEEDNSLIVSHFLALDHIGHSTSSTNDPNFGIMELRFSQFFQQIISKLKENDILIITGDHGMREDGNHGGSSTAEVQTFLFAYSPSHKILNLTKSAHISQTDITTTLSILLNIAVPTNSIGLPIFLLQGSTPDFDESIKIINANSLKHFANIIQFSSLECPKLSQKQVFQSYENFMQEKTDCFDRLAHSQPNMIIIMATIIGLAIFAGYGLYLSESNFSILVIVTLCAIPHSFSWYLLQNSSSYYLLVLLFILINSGISMKKIAECVLMVVILSQIEPVKPGDFKSNFLFSQYISNLIMNQNLQMIFLLFQVYYVTMKLYQVAKKQKFSRFSYIFSMVIFYTSFSIVFIKNILLENTTDIIIYLNYLITLLSILFCAWSLLCNQQIPTKFVLIVLWSFFSIFSNRIYFFTSGIYIFMLIRFNSAKTVRPIMGWALGQYTWWLLGNRYEYSSFDIKQSYVFSQSYHHLLNPLCLIINSLLPYMLLGLFELGQTTENFRISVREEEEERVEQESLGQKKNQQRSLKTIRFLLKPIVWLIFGAINLLYNNGKILFTVVYVPMMIIETSKFLFLVLFFCAYNSLSTR